MLMERPSFCLKMVIDRLIQRNLKYKYSSGGSMLSIYQTGCLVDLNDQYRLSIQTDPMVAGDSFAETALVSIQKNKVIYGPYGYGDVKRFPTLDALCEELDSILGESSRLS
jgi:hypothetical protein